jgi:hypothetical protein
MPCSTAASKKSVRLPPPPPGQSRRRRHHRLWPQVFHPQTRIAGNVEYLSSYIYRLAFDENLAQATSSEVQSDVASPTITSGFVPSVSLDRFQSFAGTSATAHR